MNEEEKEKESETCVNQQPNIIDELESYGNLQTLWHVNRDGDKHFVECPDCHTTDLNAVRLFGCKKCHTRFTVYAEDGIDSIRVYTQLSAIRSGGEPIKIVGKEKSTYFQQILYPRNYNKIEKIKQKWPEANIQIFVPDLRKNGMDAHSHEFYKRFVLLPLNRP